MQCLIRVSHIVKSELQQQSAFRLTSRLFVYWDGGGGAGGCVEARRGLNLLFVLFLAPRFFSRYSGFLLSLKTNISNSSYQIDNNFPWNVFLSTIEMTSLCSKLKWNHELFHCKVNREKRKQTAPPSRHFHRLYSNRPELSTNQRVRNHSVIVNFDLKSVFN